MINLKTNNSTFVESRSINDFKKENEIRGSSKDLEKLIK